MKRYIGMMVICVFMVTLSCSSKKEPIDAKKEVELKTEEKNTLLIEFEQSYNETMQQFVDFILQNKKINLVVYEEEKNYYVGYIGFNKDYQFKAAYEAEPPIVLEVDSYTMDEDKMVIIFKDSLVRETNGKKELYFTATWELILTKEMLYNYYKPFFEGKPLQGPLEVKAKIIEEPKK